MRKGQCVPPSRAASAFRLRLVCPPEGRLQGGSFPRPVGTCATPPHGVALMEQRPFPKALSRVAATPHPSRISARGNEEKLHDLYRSRPAAQRLGPPGPGHRVADPLHPPASLRPARHIYPRL